MLNLLLSFPYASPRILEKLAGIQDDCRILIDSGAFTAHHAGKVIELDDYCRFLDDLPFMPWRYFTLDVISEPEKTRINYEAMRERGYNPIPIFTSGTPIEALDTMYETSDVVGCGGIAQKYGKRAEGYLKYLWSHAEGRRIHLLGYTSLKWLRTFRPYSCDSVTWVNGARYGELKLYAGHGRFKILRRKDCVKRPPMEILRLIANMGFDPRGLQQEKEWKSYRLSTLISAASWVAAMRDFEKHLGTHIFLVGSGTTEIGLLHDAYRKQVEEVKAA